MWRGTPSEDVTIRDLLSNTSGRHWDYLTDYPALTEAANADLLAAGLDQDDEPGTTWVYNNAAIQALDVVLQEALGGDVAAFAEERLFTPLGMRNTRLTHDDDGNTRLNVGLESTCGDLARFGYLFLRGGAWPGEQVVPRRWVEEATGAPSQRLNDAYGLLWWLNRPRHGPRQRRGGPHRRPADRLGRRPGRRRHGGADTDDQMAPGAPEDMFWAVGLGDQVLQVDPGSETVVVRTGARRPRRRRRDLPGDPGRRRARRPRSAPAGAQRLRGEGVGREELLDRQLLDRDVAGGPEGGQRAEEAAAWPSPSRSTSVVTTVAGGVGGRRRARHAGVAEQLVVELGEAGVAERLGLPPHPVDQAGRVLGEVHDAGRQPVGVHEHAGSALRGGSSRWATRPR